MNSTNRHTLLGLAAVMGLGLLSLGAKPAAADPPSHAPAWGWRRKQASYNNGYRYDSRYDRGYNQRSRGYGNDVDGDGIPNSRDRDIDGDGIPNYRDNRPYGSGFDYSYGASSRYHRHGDADRDGVWNRRDRDIDGDGRRNWRDRDKDGDGRRNSRDRYPRNQRRR